MNPNGALAILRTRFDKTFSNEKSLKGFDIHIWSEGGEWPVLTNIRSYPLLRTPRFSWPNDSISVVDPIQATSKLCDALKTRKVVGLSLPCGAGKSTKMMATLLSAVDYSTVINVQPSLIVADALAEYMTNEYRTITVSRRIMKLQKALTYLSASEFITYMHETGNVADAIIVIDESQSINPVYMALQSILNLVTVPIVCMTASSYANLLPRKNVSIQKYNHTDVKLSRLYASLSNDDNKDMLIMGCSNGINVFNSSNHYVGLTMNVSKVLDLGTRLDPVIVNNEIITTYRAASVTELTQSLGRLARRSNSSGVFHYVCNPALHSLPGRTKLYSRIYECLISAFGLGIESNISTIVRTLKCNVSYDIAKPVPSTSRTGLDETDSVRSKSSTSKTSSIVSSLRSPTYDEKQKVTKSSSGYRVDYVPNDTIKRWFVPRAASWSSNALILGESTADRQNKLCTTLGEAVSTPHQASSTQPNIRSVRESMLHPHEISSVNDILTGKAIPTYMPDELLLIQRAWQTFLSVNNRHTNTSHVMEYNIRQYYDAYTRIHQS